MQRLPFSVDWKKASSIAIAFVSRLLMVAMAP
jgi:hypothetical protein